MKKNSLYGLQKSSCKLQTAVSEPVYYVIVEGQQAGPFKMSELKILVKNGTLVSSTMIWTPGLAQWVDATAIPEVNKLLLLSKKPQRVRAERMPVKSEHPLKRDLVSALTGLGYKQSASIQIVDHILRDNPEIDENDAIKEALRQFVN